MDNKSGEVKPATQVAKPATTSANLNKDTAVTGATAKSDKPDEKQTNQGNSGAGQAGNTKVSDNALQQEKADLLKRIGEIEKEFDGNTGDIPINHEYWDLMNAFRRKAR